MNPSDEDNLIRRKRLDRLIPFSGFSPDETYADGASITESDLDLTVNCFFSCRIVYESGDQGVIAEVGNTTDGMLVGINASGDLVVRFGTGVDPITAGARVVIDEGLLPQGRGFYLSWSINLTDGVMVWIDGKIVGREAITGTPTVWSDGEDGAYIDVSAAIPTEPGLTVGYDGTVLESLRYFNRTAVPYGAG